MDLDFTSEQEMLRDTAKRLFAEQATVAVVRAMEDHPVGYPTELWKQMGDLGLTGLMLPEEYGGGGQTALEGAILYEEIGRALAPTPHFVSAVMSGGAIAIGGSVGRRQQLTGIARPRQSRSSANLPLAAGDCA